jgi:amino acid adenylation domain-containing protein
MFMMQNMDIPGVEIPGLKLKPLPYETGTSKFDLMLQAIEEGERLLFIFEYGTALFTGATIERFHGYFKRIASAVMEHPSVKLSEIEIISAEEKRLILEDFNNTKRDYPSDKTINALFEEQAESTPDRIAVIAQSAERIVHSIEAASKKRCAITYKELNRKSHRLACLLREKGVRPGTIAGLMTGRTVEMIIGIWGILKAGGAYLPLTREYPGERIKYILADSNIKILVSESNISTNGLAGENMETTLVDKTGVFTPVYLPPATASSLAYVIYTSGSTGRPKGVMIRHDSLVNFIKGMTDLIDFKDTDKVLCLTEITFDIFGLETLVPLTRGSTVIMGTREQQLEPTPALQVLTREKATIFQATPSRLQLLLAYNRAKAIKILSILRYLLVGGEALPRELAEQLRPAAAENGFILYNLYGPTETTIWSSAKNLTGQAAITIGKPIANTRIYILDKYLKPAPPGIAGEICITGRGLAWGYLNQPELTTEKFILTHSSWLTADRKAMKGAVNFPMNYVYKTGDQGRWLKDGEIEFLGRVDFQVKIRGHRIELAEIENCLLSCNTIEEAIVTDRENEKGDKYLAAYFVADKSFEAQELGEYLGRQLPAYMIPSCFIQLDRIPLTVSGKIDRRALPAPESQELLAGNTYHPPETEEEKIIAGIWSDLLGLDKIGINDNFFTIGGHSLQAVRVISRIQEIFKQEVSLRLLFENPTPHRLAAAITRLQIKNMGEQNMEKMLMQIEKMTDQEAELLLEQLKG